MNFKTFLLCIFYCLRHGVLFFFLFLSALFSFLPLPSVSGFIQKHIHPSKSSFSLSSVYSHTQPQSLSAAHFLVFISRFLFLVHPAPPTLTWTSVISPTIFEIYISMNSVLGCWVYHAMTYQCLHQSVTSFILLVTLSLCLFSLYSLWIFFTALYCLLPRSAFVIDLFNQHSEVFRSCTFLSCFCVF